MCVCIYIYIFILICLYTCLLNSNIIFYFYLSYFLEAPGPPKKAMFLYIFDHFLFLLPKPGWFFVSESIPLVPRTPQAPGDHQKPFFAKLQKLSIQITKYY